MRFLGVSLSIPPRRAAGYEGDAGGNIALPFSLAAARHENDTLPCL